MSAHEILTVEAHRDLRIRTDRSAELGDAVMSCVTVPDEFRRVQNEYPILFRLSPERDEAVALGAQAEQDRIFVLHASELVGHGDAGHDRIAEFGAPIGSDPKIAVRFDGQDFMGAHGTVSAGSGARKPSRYER